MSLTHLIKSENIPISGVSIGPITKMNVLKSSLMYNKGHKKYSVILAFNVDISDDILREAEHNHVKIFQSDIIYHLLDMYMEYKLQIEDIEREAASDKAVTPCILEIIPQYIFNIKNPIIIGVHVKEGSLKINTPLVVFTKSEMLTLGKVIRIEMNQQSVESAEKGMEVSISIEGNNYMYGQHFDHKQKLYSHLTRRSINSLKEFFMDTLTPERIKLIRKLKLKFGIN